MSVASYQEDPTSDVKAKAAESAISDALTDKTTEFRSPVIT
jgi:hypothetical protein